MGTQTQTIVCPNCGANTANTQYCEYCGSKLIGPNIFTKLKQKSDKTEIKKYFTTPFSNFADRLLKEFDTAKYKNSLGEKFTFTEYIDDRENGNVVGAVNLVSMGINCGNICTVEFTFTQDGDRTKCVYDIENWVLLYKVSYNKSVKNFVTEVLNSID